MQKHAYLIIAHKADLTFHTLLKMLDDKRNDIFIHMDKKTSKYDINEITALIKQSNVYHVDRLNVTWGGYSQINVELSLLSAATKERKYAYYHLLSGEDMPIKSQDYIHDFFEKHSGEEFVQFEDNMNADRLRYYHWFREKVQRKKFSFYKPLYRLSLGIQKHLLGVNRIHDCGIRFKKGANWFSITDDLARFVCDKRAWIEKCFKNTDCCDEIFLQTLVHNSPFKQQLHHEQYDNFLGAHMRLIDWKRGGPYIFRKQDFEEIKASKMLWARKFDSLVDKEIIELVYREFS